MGEDFFSIFSFGEIAITNRLWDTGLALLFYLFYVVKTLSCGYGLWLAGSGFAGLFFFFFLPSMESINNLQK